MAHRVPLKELAQNHSALHNTQEKIHARKQMIAGERPKECQYCWNIEDNTNQLSDRAFKSSEPWSLPFLGQVLQNPADERFLPRYLEVSFSRACNFKCSYCSPAFSTTWAKDVADGGNYPGRDFIGEMSAENFYPEEQNPYIAAFWKWWPEAKNALEVFRITGGEPLLSPNTFRVMDMLLEDPAPNLEFSINSNLGVPQAKVQSAIDRTKILLDQKKIKKFLLFTSFEAWEARAEYIRFGLDARLFWANFETVLRELPSVTITVMVTFNALSVTSFHHFLRHILQLRERYSTEQRPTPIILDISYLRHPSYLAVNILPDYYRDRVKELVEYMKENSAARLQKPWGFVEMECSKMERTQQWMGTLPSPEILQRERLTFYNFYSEHDRRRGTSFLNTFPEMTPFWNECRHLALSGVNPPAP